MNEIKCDERLALEEELAKCGITIEQLNKAVDWLVSTFKQTWKALKKMISDLYDIILFSATSNPKYYYRYKYAKKSRIRKKYHRLLTRELLTYIAKGATT